MIMFSSFRVDVNKFEGYAKLSFSKAINLVGQYTAKGKVQVLAINGKGPCNITLSKFYFFFIIFWSKTTSKKK